MALLSTNYVDDVLDTTKNTMRKYVEIDNGDNTKSFQDATKYAEEGSSFGAAEINTITDTVNNKTTNNGTPCKIDFTLRGTSLYITTTNES